MAAIMYVAVGEKMMRWVGLSLKMLNVAVEMMLAELVIGVGLAGHCIFSLGSARIILVWSVMRTNYQNCIYYLSFSLIFLNLMQDYQY